MLGVVEEPIIAAQTAITGHSFVKVVKIIMYYTLMVDYLHINGVQIF